MSQIEKTFFKVAALAIGVLAFQACGNGFVATSASSGSNSAVNGPFAKNSPDFSGLATSVGQILGLAAQNFPGISTLASCESISACSGAGPSSQTITANCAGAGLTLSGQTLLTFNAGQCSALSSSQLTIAPSLTLALSGGQTFAISSAPHADYSDQNYGGGLVVNYSLSSASGGINDLGLRFTATGSHPMDISTHSVSAFTGAVDITNARVTLNGGPLIVADNLQQYTSSLALNNLSFGAGCTCPTSGSVSGSLSGAFSGSLTITFNSCGSVTIVAPTYGVNSTTTVQGCTPL